MANPSLTSPAPGPPSTSAEVQVPNDNPSWAMHPKTSTSTKSPSFPKQPKQPPINDLNCVIPDFPDPFAPSSSCNSMAKLYGVSPERLQFDTSIVPKGFNIPDTPFGVIIPCGHINAKTLEVYLVQENKTTAVVVDDVTDSGFRIPKGMPAGIHTLLVIADRVDGLDSFSDVVTLTFGSLQLQIAIVMPDGVTPAPNVTATITIITHPGFQITNFTDEKGWADLNHLPPGQSLTLEITLGELARSIVVKPDYVRVIFRLRELGEPSDVDNMDFSLGLEGWDIDTTPGVTRLLDHENNNVTDHITVKPKGGNTLRRLNVWKRDRPKGPSPTKVNKKDIAVTTRGPGTRYAAYTTKVPKGYKAINIEGRFLTYEYPKYYGKEFDDAYAIIVISKKLGVNTKSGSMNALPADAFTTNGVYGYTDWILLQAPVDPQGDTVRIELAVSNVADGKVDSSLIVTEIALVPISDKEVNCGDPETFANDFYQSYCPRCVMKDDGPTIGYSKELFTPFYRDRLQFHDIQLDSMKTILKNCPKTCNEAPCSEGERNCIPPEVADDVFGDITLPILMNVAASFARNVPPGVQVAIASMVVKGLDQLGPLKEFKAALDRKDYGEASEALLRSPYCQKFKCDVLVQCIASAGGVFGDDPADPGQPAGPEER
ncbi:hypothetical protein HDU97_001430 [Phlyctochytrium planicorne]|nr:hypothetical protein HDU97_001430 [Phlyctochytrium planicorne]